jgi:predicted RNase H-like HicB family nuclease
MNYSVTLVESDEGWAIWCDSLPGCCSQGATREEALANIRAAITEYQEAKAIVNEDELGVRSVQHDTVTV